MANFNSNPRGGLTVDRDSLHASDGYKRQIAAMELMKESEMIEKMDSERSPFESWVQTTSGWKACKQRGKHMHLRQNADGSYNDFRVNDRWCAWKARAHTAQPVQAVDVGAIREVIELLEVFPSTTNKNMADKLTCAIGIAHDTK